MIIKFYKHRYKNRKRRIIIISNYSLFHLLFYIFCIIIYVLLEREKLKSAGEEEKKNLTEIEKIKKEIEAL